MRARAEPFGAWVRAPDGTLVAIGREAAARLGVDGGPIWSGAAHLPRPLEVHVAVTSRCGAGCKGCYLDARPDGESPPFAEIAARLRAVARAGAFTVAFGGGEPLSRPDLGELGELARSLGLLPVVTTSGLGMTRERALSLRSFAQVNVSYDGEGAAYGEVRGWDGARVAERAMRLLAEAGVPFGVNTVLTRASFPRLASTVRRAEELGAREVQLLRYKPAGRAASASYLAARLSTPQVASLGPALEALGRSGAVAIRIDCALVPLLSEHLDDAAVLARFGVLGCEAGRYLAAVRVDGALAPCSFAPAADVAVAAAWTEGAWEADPTLASYRAPHEAEPCRTCPLRTVCRGGCRVVASHLEGDLAPDPECPRVKAHRLRVRAQELEREAEG
jgi:radical SAM protein with 4Fe4S-binding SPASM domain